MTNSDEIKQVRVDLHMHSEYSKDSLNTLEDIIRTCQRKGLDVLCRQPGHSDTTVWKDRQVGFDSFPGGHV